MGSYRLLNQHVFVEAKKGWGNQLICCKPPQTASKCILDYILAVASDQLIGDWLYMLLWALKINAFVAQSTRSWMGGKKGQKFYTLHARDIGVTRYFNWNLLSAVRACTLKSGVVWKSTCAPWDSELCRNRLPAATPHPRRWRRRRWNWRRASQWTQKASFGPAPRPDRPASLLT